MNLSTNTTVRSLALASIAAAFASAAGACGLEFVLNDDFEDRDDAGWIHASSLGAGTGLWNVTNGLYTLSTSVQLPASPGVQWVASGYEAAYVNPEAFADGTVRAAFRLNNVRTNAGIVLRDDAVGTFVHFFANNASPGLAGGVGIQVSVGNSTILEEFTETTLDVNAWYHLEATAIGADLQVRAWPIGQPRPTEPTMAVESDLVTSGGVALLVYSQPTTLGGGAGSISATFDNVIFTPAGAVPGDLDGDGSINGADLGTMLAAWGGPGAADLDGNGTTDGGDLGTLLAGWTG